MFIAYISHAFSWLEPSSNQLVKVRAELQLIKPRAEVTGRAETCTILLELAHRDKVRTGVPSQMSFPNPKVNPKATPN